MLESEILDGARFYTRLVRAYAERLVESGGLSRLLGTRASRSTSGCCATPPARTTGSTPASSPTTCAPRSPTPPCSTRSGCSPRTTSRRSARGWRRWGAEHAAGEWRIELADEDVHTALETRLTARIGDAGARLHLGRSRNDQVLAALRLYLRDAVAALAAGAREVAGALDELGSREAATALPGYTHLQQAMPSSVPLWAGGFAAELRDDAAGARGLLAADREEPPGLGGGVRRAAACRSTASRPAGGWASRRSTSR